MRRAVGFGLSIAATLAIGAPAIATPPDQLYTLNCWGCHQPRAEGIAGTVPRLAGSMGYFLELPEGRAYLVQVPGVSGSPLSDKEIADVLNWLLESFSKDQLPSGSRRYTEAEVHALRSHRLADVQATRRELVKKLADAGYAIPQDGEHERPAK